MFTIENKPEERAMTYYIAYNIDAAPGENVHTDANDDWHRDGSTFSTFIDCYAALDRALWSKNERMVKCFRNCAIVRDDGTVILWTSGGGEWTNEEGNRVAHRKCGPHDDTVILAEYKR